MPSHAPPQAAPGASTRSHPGIRPDIRPGIRPDIRPDIRRDIRPWIYAACDLVLALIYAYVLFALIPGRHAWLHVVRVVIVLAPVVMAASMVARRSWAWWPAVTSCAVLLCCALLLLTLTLLSVAFLAGVYGSLGRAASALSLVGAALIIEFMGIVPALQMKYLMTRAGRRAFARKPLWPS